MGRAAAALALRKRRNERSGEPESKMGCTSVIQGSRLNQPTLGPPMVSHSQFLAFCHLADKAVRKFYGRPGFAVSFRLASSAKCSLISEITSDPLRVEAAFFPDDRKLHGGFVLGHFDDGTRQLPIRTSRCMGANANRRMAGYCLITGLSAIGPQEDVCDSSEAAA